MNRNSTTIFIETGDVLNPCITPIPWREGSPDVEGIEEPSRSVYLKAYEEGKDNIVVIPDFESDNSTLVREVDARRLRLALFQLGYLDSINTAIESLQNPAVTINWEYATIIKENHPLVLNLVNNLKLNTEEIFNLANSLE